MLMVMLALNGVFTSLPPPSELSQVDLTLVVTRGDASKPAKVHRCRSWVKRDLVSAMNKANLKEVLEILLASPEEKHRSCPRYLLAQFVERDYPQHFRLRAVIYGRGTNNGSGVKPVVTERATPVPKKKVDLTFFFKKGSPLLNAHHHVLLTKRLPVFSRAVRLDVAGYSSREGPESKNTLLSCHRALSVRAWLVRAGIDPRKIGIKCVPNPGGCLPHPYLRKATIRIIEASQ